MTSELFDRVELFLSRFVAYPSEAARVAHVLWIGHAHLMHLWESTPRIAFVSAEPGSGKSRALEVTGPLVPNPVHAVNASPAYLFRKVSDPDGAPTVLFDEIDTIFGPKAKDNEEIRGMLNAGHRRGAMAGRCVIRGKEVLTEELPAYCAVALAGLDDLPDTIRTRSVMVRMRRRGPGEYVEPWRARLNEPEAHQLREDLTTWAAGVDGLAQWPDMPDGVEDRNADVWEALLAVADLAGGHWPQRGRVSAVTLVTDAAANGRQTFGVQLLADLRKVFGTSKAMSTDEVLRHLHAMEDSPWGDLRGREMTARDLANRLKKYTDANGEPIRPQAIRVGEEVFKGYRRADLEDAWARYLSEPAEQVTTPVVTSAPDPLAEVGNHFPPDHTDGVSHGETPAPRLSSAVSVTSVTPVTQPAVVTAVTAVTEESQQARPEPACPSCGGPNTVDRDAIGYDCLDCHYGVTR